MAQADPPTTGSSTSAGAAKGARFAPFADDATVQTIGGLSLENGTDAIAIHGSVDLTRDAAGLARARALAAALAAIVAALEGRPLPDQAETATLAGDMRKNPFA